MPTRNSSTPRDRTPTPRTAAASHRRRLRPAHRSMRPRIKRSIAALAVGAGLLVVPTAQALPGEERPAPSRDGSSAGDRSERGDDAAPRRDEGFVIATLNLHNALSPSQMRSDVQKMIATRHPSIIGFQERRDTGAAMRAALPEGWALRMPTTGDGTDDNPIAFDTRVWKAKHAWPRLLTGRTWARSSGQQAIDQFGTVVVLEHRQTGQVVRAISFHMPNLIHNRSTGGPNYAEPQRLGAFNRMAANVRDVARSTPAAHQFVAMCDCNVTESRDTSDKLVKGRLTQPLGLENNYSAAGYKNGWRIDYVMSEKDADYRIASWKVMHDLHTDHPGVVTRFAPQPEVAAKSYDTTLPLGR